MVFETARKSSGAVEHSVALFPVIITFIDDANITSLKKSIIDVVVMESLNLPFLPSSIVEQWMLAADNEEVK